MIHRINPSRKPARSRSLATALLAVALVTGVACQTSGPPPVATSGTSLGLDIPSPLAGPGRGTIDTTERRAINGAWNHLLSGRSGDARASIARFESPQARLLELQIDLVDGPSSELQAMLEEFVAEHSQYAAGWVTLSTAAEIQGNESEALMAARQSARLWPQGPFAGKADDLYRRWVDDRIKQGKTRLEAAQPMEALSITELALALEPENQAALLTRAEALMHLQQGPEAEATLSRLGALPEALVMRADMASDKGNWQHAMSLLETLPNDYPSKDKALRKARLMWRMSVLPAHVQEAVTSPSLTREQLAVIILAMVPSLEIQPGGSTPLMTDIINLPSQRAILTATRLEIMTTDHVARLFHPKRGVTEAETKTAIETVCHLSGFTPPLWCEKGMSRDDGCSLIDNPVKGSDVVETLLSVDLGADT